MSYQASKIKSATYKGRTYICLWSGKTKTGKDMAKLGFMDGSKQFWVDLAAVSDIATVDYSTRPSKAQRDYDHRSGFASTPFGDDYVS